MAQAVDVEKTRDDLIDAFEQRQSELKENTDYYESNRRPSAIGLAVPPQMRDLLAHVGYSRIYINALTERLEIEGFRLGGADDADADLWDWFQANDLDVESALGHTDACVQGRSYVTIAAPDPKIDLNVDPNVPIIRVEPPTNLYAVIDPRTREVSQAIRAIYDDDGSQVIAATLYLPDRTVSWVREDNEFKILSTVNHGMDLVPVVPLSNRTRLSDLYGTSEITPELKSVTDAAARVLMNMQGTAELMAVPQRLLFGVKPEEIGVDENGRSNFDAYLARILAFEDHESKAQQFAAAELRNFVDALDALDKKAAAYTGLPPQYLATLSDNPASAEAIRAAESRLVKNAERKCLVFGAAWEQVMRVAYKVMNTGGDIPPEYYRMECIWRDPSTPTYAAKADAAAKLYANGTGVIPKERARIDMGYTIAEREEMKRWDEEENPLGLLGTVFDGPTPALDKKPAATPPAQEALSGPAAAKA